MYKKSKKLLAWSLVVCMILTNILFTNAFAFERVSGTDRYETAAEIALEAYEDGTDTAILATGLVGADALAAAPLAAQLDAPILLTAKNELPDATIEALEDLGVEKVVVVGGKGAVSEDVVEELEDLGYEVERIAGSDRFETSLLIAKELDDAEAAFLVNGIKTADALSVSSIAAALGMPILLTAANNVREDIVEFLADMDVYVVGGKAAVSDDVLEEVDGERIAVSGGDRFDTNIAVIEAFEDDLEFDVVYVASALDAKFADALAGGPLAAMTNSAVLLVGASVADATEDFVEEYLDEEVTFIALGGTASVSNSVLKELEKLAGVEAEDEITSVKVVETVYDDDTPGQMVNFRINGQSKNADYNEVLQMGYEIEFIATDEDGDPAEIFYLNDDTEDSESTTGLLADEIDHGKYEIEIIITLNDKYVVSDTGIIEVKDLEGLAKSITEIELENVNGFTHNSNVLIEGETAEITKVTGNYAGKTGVSIPLDLISVESDDESVISVEEVDNDIFVLTAENPGKAGITVKCADASKKFTFEVKDDIEENLRALNKVVPSQDSVKLLNGSFWIVALEVLDQYGDPFTAASLGDEAGYEIFVDVPVNAKGSPLVAVAGEPDGEEVDEEVDGLTITAEETGKGTLLFKDEDEDGKVLGKLSIDVTGTDESPHSLKAEIFDYLTESDDFKLNVDDEDDDKVVFTVNEYTKDGYFIEFVDVDYESPNDHPVYLETTDVDEKVIKIEVINDVIVQVTAEGEGKAEIIVRDAENDRKIQVIKVEVTEDPVFATDVKWKSVSTITARGKAITVKDVLDIREVRGSDPIVYGFEHNAATGAKVRLGELDKVSFRIYIDEDDDGVFNDDDDIELGTLTARLATGFTLGEGSMLGDLDVSLDSEVETVKGDKGTIIFEFEDLDGKTIAKTSIKVDVK